MRGTFSETSVQNEEFEGFCNFVRKNIIGDTKNIKTPFGDRQVVYLDWTASGRSLKFIEESLIDNVMPYYGNTHSVASNNARQSTWFTHEAREVVRDFVGGNPDDAIIFTGYGSSGGITKFLRMADASNWISFITRFEKNTNVVIPNEKKPILKNGISDSISMNVVQDRWKSYKCVKCDTQYNTEAAFRRHFNKLHKKEKQIDSKCKEEIDSLPSERKHEESMLFYEIIFLIDPSSHHSLFLPFVDYAKKNSTYSKFGHNYFIKFGLEFLKLNCKGEVDYHHLSERAKQITSKNRNSSVITGESQGENSENKQGVKTIPFVLLSAGSNITGRLNDYNKISSLIHDYNGFSIVDFAATAPHSRPNMSPPLNVSGGVDAGVFSPHKFIGGPSTPGILVIKRDLLLSESPSDPGGNSVFFVSLEDHEYLLNKEEREESGTIDILGISRLGMMMKFELNLPQKIKRLKEKFLFESLLSKLEEYNWKSGSCKRIKILGYEELLADNGRGNVGFEGSKHEDSKFSKTEGSYLENLPIVSFLIRPFINVEGNLILNFLGDDFPKKILLGEKDDKIEDYYLHYNFVCSLLNDLFGIQSRGGCSCAGPYSQRLLGYDSYSTKELYNDLVIRGIESIRPGFSRVSLHWSLDFKTVDYVAKAIIWIAEHGWKFLPLYIFEESLGTWRHRSEWKSLEKIHRKWLTDSVSDYNIEKYKYIGEKNLTNKADNKEINFDKIFEIANEILLNVESIILNNKTCENHCKVGRNDGLYSDLDSDMLESIIYKNNQHFTSSINNMDLCNLSDFELLSESNLLWFVTPKCVQNIVFAIRNNIKYIKNDFNDLNYSTDSESKCVDLSINVENEVCTRKMAEIKERNKILPKPSDFGNIRKYVGMAIKKFDMIKNGDNILVAVSGGKDSLTMLNTLLFLKKVAPVKFNIAAATIDPQTSEMDASKLIPYMEMIGVKYHFISYPIVEIASKIKQKQKKISYCAFCARMKRGLLYSCMKKNGYNVLALGQHLDDICESFLLSLLNNGKLNTMKANYTVSEYNIRVIRPMIYCREKELANFAIKSGLPIIAENCPACFSQPKERRHIKQLLSQEESHNPTIYSSILNALHPLISINHTNSNGLNKNSVVEDKKSCNESLNDSLTPFLDEDITTEMLLTSSCKI
ncbi:hypothetical protein FG386_002333 [Cryptosporidium ryanae]|uniref:uncharacterized protein n=1 Tax=Cryptosporidium ryanae TaxID=515981 RepID=UPI00351A407E|nr:hypothetical protein FG386_002333 [Cryptosporidium ryanae]